MHEKKSQASDYRSLHRVAMTLGIPRKAFVLGITATLCLFHATHSFVAAPLFFGLYWATAYALIAWEPRLLKMIPSLWRQKVYYCPKMVGYKDGRKRMWRDWFSGVGALSDEIELKRFVTKTIFETRCGAFGSVLQLDGSDPDSRTVEDIERITDNFQKARRNFDHRFRIYEYISKRFATAIEPRADYPNEQSRAVSLRRLEDFGHRSQPLAEIRLSLVVLFEPDPIKRWVGFSPKRSQASLLAQKMRSIETLTGAIKSFVSSSSDTLSPILLEEKEATDFFRSLLNPCPVHSRHYHAEPGALLARSVADTSIRPKGKALQMGRSYVATAAMIKTTPLRPEPSQIQQGLLSLPFEFVACMEWKQFTAQKMRSFIKTNLKAFEAQGVNLMAAVLHMPQEPMEERHAKRDVNYVQKKLGDSLEEIEQGLIFGDWSCVVTFFDSERRANFHELVKTFGRFDASVVEEDHNLPNAYLSMIPGNHQRNFNYSFLSDKDCAAMAYGWKSFTGDKVNRHLRDEYLCLYETEDGQPFYFNAHVGGNMGILKLGESGTGKSFDTNYQLANMQKYDPITLILDVGGSYRDLVREFGGSYYHVSASRQDASMNPFAVEGTPEQRQFLIRFVKMLAGVDQQSPDVKVSEETDIVAAVDDIFYQEKSNRRLGQLSLSRSLKTRIARWIGDGQFAHVFDNADDSVTFTGMTCFEFQGMDQVPEVAAALCAYITWRFDAIVYDPAIEERLKVLVIDEAWVWMFENSEMGRYMVNKFKTGRKHNLGTMLITQSTLDTAKAGFAELINEACPTKIFFSNPNIQPKTYQTQHDLNEIQARRIASLKPREELAILRTDPNRLGFKQFKVVKLVIGNAEDRLAYSSDPRSNSQKRKMAAIA